jgi:type IX secretion system PorP/SprF family membrane protein
LRLASIHIITLMLMLVNLATVAQDIHFSQILSNPLFLNPASTGLFDGDLRIGASYRSQGKSISVPYTTYSAWGDTHFEAGNSGTTAFGVGLSFFSDNAGEGSLNTSSGYANAALIKGFNADNSFRAALGISVGGINRSVDFSKLVFDNQWDGTVFDPDAFSNETYASNSVFAPDLSIGGVVCWDINKMYRTIFGLSMGHVNKPKLSFYGEGYRLEYRFMFHALMQVKLNEQIHLLPGAYFGIQQFANELMVGGNIYFIRDDMRFISGVWYRHERDIVPQIGFYLNDFTLQFSYDINISKLHIASNYRGGIEISLLKTIASRKKFPGCNAF